MRKSARHMTKSNGQQNRLQRSNIVPK